MKYVAIYLVIVFFGSCKSPHSETSFYYWKTNFKLSALESEILQKNKVETLYIRFFDIDLSKETQKPVPLGLLAHEDSIPREFHIIPVVFITNRTFINLSKAEIDLLAKHVIQKIDALKSDYEELQFDCDWSNKTKDNYFYFLEQIRKIIGKNKNLSSTIRLHQVKYYNKTGIPPVERGMIMFYNMGDLSSKKETNSIYNKTNSDKYIKYLKNYPLPSDVALPIFNWYVHYRDGKVLGLITKKTIPDVRDTTHFARIEKSFSFAVKLSFFENGIYYQEEDVLRKEELSEEELLNAAKDVLENLPTLKRKIVYYDLDELNLKNYNENIFKKISDIAN
ncbi:hypothetical protein CNR22_15735 [Sphingobacteriaceae bacterium]|nr:hypothetical protein CNR22_15735 [Sphingobacteriaceae bacterium]